MHRPDFAIRSYLDGAAFPRALRTIAAAAFAGISGLALRAPGSGAEVYVGGGSGAYAFSLLIAGLAALPALVFFSKTFYLNNRKNRA